MKKNKELKTNKSEYSSIGISQKKNINFDKRNLECLIKKINNNETNNVPNIMSNENTDSSDEIFTEIKINLKNNKNFDFYQKNNYVMFIFYLLFPILVVFIYSSVEMNPKRLSNDNICISYVSYLFWYRGFYIFFNFGIINYYYPGFIKDNILSGKYKSFLINIFFTVVESIIFHFSYKNNEESFFIKNYFHFFVFYTNSFIYIIADQFSCLKKKKGFNKNEELNLKNECPQNEISDFNNKDFSDNNKIYTNLDIINKENNDNKSFLNHSYHRDNNHLYNLHNKYLLGGKLKSEIPPSTKKLNREFIIFYAFISLSFGTIMYLFSTAIVRNFHEMKSFYGRHVVFIIFYLGWFLICRVAQFTLRLWNMKFKNGIFVISLAMQLFFHINYRILFLDKNFLIKEAVFLILENTMIEFIEFFIPMTSKFFKLKEKFPLILNILGYQGKQEYLRFKVSFNYFLKMVSLFYSIFGTLVQFLAIKISKNSDAFDIDLIGNIDIVFYKMSFTLFVEIVVYLLIEYLIRKFYKISSLKNYYILISNKTFMISSICLTIHILQDPIITLVDKCKFC